MGGFASLLKPLMAKGLDTAAPALEHGGDLWSKYGASMDTVMRSHPAGTVVADYMQDFVKTREQAFQKLEAPAKKLWDGIGKDSKLGTQINPNKESIGDIHQKLDAQGHPLAQHSKQLIMQNLDKSGQSKNADLTLQQLSSANHAQANLMARSTVLGPNSENIIPAVEELFRSKEPKDNALGQLVIDSVSNITKDTITQRGAPVSGVKSDIFKAFQTKNKVNAKYGTGVPDLELPKTGATYTETSKPEAAARGFLVNRMADMAAIPHLSMLGNISSAPMKAIVQGITSLGDKDLKELVQASGLLAQTQHAIFDNQLRGSSSLLGKIVGKDAGSLFYNATHMPLFNMLRLHQLSLGASVGYHSAIMWGEAAAKGDKRAIAELREMRLDPQSIVERGGKLTDEELKTAMFHYGNNKFFVARPMDQSLRANSNFYMRSATMFHKTINSQYYFMKNELMKMYKAGDIKGIAQFAGTLGILFPAVAPWIKSATILARTASPSQAQGELQKNYSNLSGANGFGNFAESYIDMLSYIGGFGIYHSYVQAAYHDRLATAAIGPMIGEGLTVAQDAISATKTNKQGTHNLAPIGRDAASMSVPVVGKWLGYKLFPTAQKGESKTGRHSRKRR